ncbi:MAG: hypothetical protein ABI210_10895, partial [Abditibacteriaceae bacterium]
GSVADGSGQVFLPINLLNNNFPVVGLVADPNNQIVPAAVPSPVADDKTGQVTYGASFSGYHTRTVYQGLDEWASQISPTAQSYVPYVNSGTMNVPNYRGVYSSTGVYTRGSHPRYLPREPWREYYVKWNNPGALQSANIIYFHANEAGKPVVVSFIDTTGKKWINQIMTVDNIITTPTPGVLSADFAPTGSAATLQLKDATGNPLAANSILDIRGLGIIARTAWLNGNKFNQSVVTGYRTTNTG